MIRPTKAELEEALKTIDDLVAFQVASVPGGITPVPGLVAVCDFLRQLASETEAQTLQRMSAEGLWASAQIAANFNPEGCCGGVCGNSGCQCNEKWEWKDDSSCPCGSETGEGCAVTGCPMIQEEQPVILSKRAEEAMTILQSEAQRLGLYDDKGDSNG